MTAVVETRGQVGPLVPRPAVIVGVHRETHDTVTVEFAMDGPTVPIAAGQFVMAYVHRVGEAPISVSSDPASTAHRTMTVRSVGSVTRALTSSAPGTTIGIRGPFGRPWPVAAAEGGDLVVVAGGIGLAPVRPAVLQALRDRGRFRRVVVCVGARSPEDLVFGDDLSAWADDPGVELSVIVDRASRGWTGEVGLVTRPLSRVALDPARTTALICGPDIMMRVAARALLARDVPADQVHVTLERNMRCAVGTCGHCQLGPVLVCRDGAVFPYPEVGPLMEVRSL